MTEPLPKKRRFRPLRWLLVLLLLLVVVAIVAPWVAGPLARGPIERALEQRLYADANLGSLRLSHGGGAHLRELVLTHPDGRPLATVDAVDADVSLLGALTGDYGLDVDVRGVTLHAKLDEDGNLDLKEIVRTEEGDADQGPAGKPRGEGRPAPESEKPTQLPHLRAHVSVTDVALYLDTPDGPAEISGGTFELDVVDLDQLADFVLTAAVASVPAGMVTKGLVPPELVRPGEPFALDVRGRARYLPARGEVELASLTFETPLVRGNMTGRVQLEPSAGEGLRLEGCEGELRYVPDRIAALLGDKLPGKLSGAGDERLAFRFSGAPPSDLASLLQGDDAHLDLGLGRFAAWGLAGDGKLSVDLAGGLAQLGGTWGANAGSLSLTGNMDTRAPSQGVAPRSFLRFELKAVEANTQLASLLAYVHPVFASLAGATGGVLDGLLSASFEVGLDGTLDVAALTADPGSLLQQPLKGGGKLQLSGLKLQGSPLVSSLVSNLGTAGKKATTEGIDVQPMEFALDGGQVKYAKPWGWSIGGVETTFTGSIGLDRGLDLAWNVPVTEELVARYDFLGDAVGETLSVPLGGTLDAPRLDWGPALAGFAKGALTREAAQRLGLGDLGADLGDGLGLDDLAGLAGLGGKQGKADKEGDESPDALYRRANKLWDDGQREDAVALYQRLKDDHKLTLVYTLNRGRINDRIDWLERKRKKDKKKAQEGGGG